MRRLPSPARTLVLCLLTASASALSGCASHGTAVPQPFPTPGGSGPAARVATPASPEAPVPDAAPDAFPLPPVTSMAAEGVVSTALHLLGTRYRNGGADPDGFDCSGFVQYVFAQQGV